MLIKDPASPDWIVSVVTPIDGRNRTDILPALGNDIVLNDLIERANTDRSIGNLQLYCAAGRQFDCPP